MAAGTPVIALEGNGVREVVDDGRNGLLLHGEDIEDFSEAIARFERLPKAERTRMRRNARAKADAFDQRSCAKRALNAYEKSISSGAALPAVEGSAWDKAAEILRAEWDLFANVAQAAGSAFLSHQR